MQKQIFLTLGYVVLSDFAALCSRTDVQLQSSVATVKKSTPHSVPSVKLAIVKAIELTKGRNLFNQSDKDSDSEDDIVFGKSVEILGSKQTNGSVKVVFSLPTSGVIVSEGRLATKKLFEVTFTRAGVASNSYMGKSQRQQPHLDTADKQEAKFCKAISVVCSQFRNQNKMEFAVGIGAKKKKDDGLIVFVENVPYMPGGHTGYILSKDLKLVRTSPGR